MTRSAPPERSNGASSPGSSSSDRLRPEALALAGLLAQRPPLAVAAIKRALHRGLDGSLDAGLRREQEEFGRLLASEDAREGVSAFLEKRPPSWRGR